MNRKTIYLMYPKRIGTISPEIYGHFTEQIGGVFYDGLWVGKDSTIPNINGFRKEIVEKLRHIKAPVLRWPGGCFAETYNWRDGIGKDRPVRVSWWTKNDGRYESNAVGTHEFMELCELVGAKAYLAANLTTVPILHIQEWMDYCLSPRGTTTLAKEREANGHPEPFDVPFWGVGNENWGGGGNMKPEYYANEYKRLAMIMHNTFPEVELISCGSNGEDYSWTDNLFRNVRGAQYDIAMSGFGMHYYCEKAGEALDYAEEDWTRILLKAANMENLIKRNWHIIRGYAPANNTKLVVDEWGCWYSPGSGPTKGYYLYEQQSTMRDAVVSALTLNIFNNHCDKVRMANVAQVVNNLHALFLANGENCVTTPTYHVFDMYKEHQGAEAIEAFVTDNTEFTSAISVSASVKEGKTVITLANLSYKEDAEIELRCIDGIRGGVAEGWILSHDDVRAHNTFENPNEVEPKKIKVDVDQVFILPSASVMSLWF